MAIFEFTGRNSLIGTFEFISNNKLNEAQSLEFVGRNILMTAGMFEFTGRNDLLAHETFEFVGRNQLLGDPPVIRGSYIFDRTHGL